MLQTEMLPTVTLGVATPLVLEGEEGTEGTSALDYL